jgi:peptidyl-prolyl cis-trans isomerase B (cyclophilin B)
MKHLIFFSLLSFLFVQCNSSEEVELLKRSNAALKAQQDSLLKQVDVLQKDRIKLNFLSKQLEGVTAEIVTSLGRIKLAFYPDKAPIHVFSFISRAESGYYDGSSFHRVIEGFMIQGGDPNSKDDNPNNDGMGGPIVNIPHEFNDTPHERGVLSMARISNVGAGAGSQFFIMHAKNSSLDEQYTVFGRVTEGMDVVDKIATVEKNERNRPLQKVEIKQILVNK